MKFSKQLKPKDVLESLKEQDPHGVMAKRFELTSTQISAWRLPALKYFVI